MVIWLLRFFGDGKPPTFNRESGNPYNGYINPYKWVDDQPLLYGNNGSLDPGTYGKWVLSPFPSIKKMLGHGSSREMSIQLMVWLVGLGPGDLDYLGSPYERDCYIGAPLESQTTGPQPQQLPPGSLTVRP